MKLAVPNTRTRGGASIAALLLSLFTALAHADITITVQQAGSNVSFSYKGSLDMSTFTTSTGTLGSEVDPENSEISFADGTSDALETVNDDPVNSSPIQFGMGSSNVSGVFNGDPFVITPSSMAVPNGYVSGDQISGSLLISGATLPSLGIDPSGGPYVWTLTSGETVTLIFPAAITIAAVEIDGGVTLTYGGSLVTSSFTTFVDSYDSTIDPANGELYFGDGTASAFETVNGNPVISDPGSFGTGLYNENGIFSGDPFVITSDAIAYPNGYGSGSELSGSLTYPGETFTSLGIDPSGGPYIWGLSTGEVIALIFPTFPAAIAITAAETDGDVVLSYSGSLDTSTFSSVTSDGQGAIEPESAQVTFADETVDALEAVSDGHVISSPGNFGSGGFNNDGVLSGDHFAINNFEFAYPSGYISGDPLSGSLTFPDETFDSLGMSPAAAPYLWILSSGDVISLEIPLPPSVVSPDVVSPNAVLRTSLLNKIRKLKKKAKKAKRAGNSATAKRLKKKIKKLTQQVRTL